LWSKTHDGGEHTLLLGNGNELAAVNIKLIYKISDLYSYLKKCSNPESILSAAAYETLTRQTVNSTLDTFLSIDRSSLAVSLADELDKFCISNGLGLEIVQVIIESIHPPVEIADVYQMVVTASIAKSTIITYAQSTAEQQLISADEQSKSAVYSAMKDQHERVSDAMEEMAVYYSAMEAYRVNPASFRFTKYIDTYEKIINGKKVYVFSPGTEGNISKFIIGGKATDVAQYTE